MIAYVVQVTFVFLVLPCLMLGYMGQAAYLIDKGGDPTQAFFSSIPGELPVSSSLNYKPFLIPLYTY